MRCGEERREIHKKAKLLGISRSDDTAEEAEPTTDMPSMSRMTGHVAPAALARPLLLDFSVQRRAASYEALRWAEKSRSKGRRCGSSSASAEERGKFSLAKRGKFSQATTAGRTFRSD